MLPGVSAGAILEPGSELFEEGRQGLVLPARALAGLLPKSLGGSRGGLRTSAQRARRASAGAALLIGIGRVVLELVMETDVVHALESLVLGRQDYYGSAAAPALQRVLCDRHRRILALPPQYCDAAFTGLAAQHLLAPGGSESRRQSAVIREPWHSV